MMFHRAIVSRSACALLSIALVTYVARLATAAEDYTENPGTEGNGDHVIGPDY